VDLTGKVCVVTGATSGIGFATACQLAALGATVVALGRDPDRGQQVAAAVRDAGGVPDLQLGDLSRQSEVRRLAGVIADRYPSVHALCQVAGVDVGVREVTADGLELTFAVNHLAHFLLTSLLLPSLEAAAPSRIVTVSSGAHHAGRMDFDDLQGAQQWRGQKAYNQSKLANVLFTMELARRLDGTGVTANAVDPGWVKGTNLGRTASLGLKAMGVAMTPFMVDADTAAQAVVWAAVSPELGTASGCYLVKNKGQAPGRSARDEAVAARLWAVSEELTGLGPPAG
jgi:NAD(P)-dependent dehydrogenase (short-subunit alcohol dehydrogenase family)